MGAEEQLTPEPAIAGTPCQTCPGSQAAWQSKVQLVQTLGLGLPVCPRASSHREVLARWSLYHSTCMRIKAQGAPGMHREVGGGALR